MDAEDLLLREFLGVRTAEQTQAAARWIASQQRDDGTWANFYGGPGDLSTTVEAYVALRLAGHEPQAPHLARAADVDPRPGRNPGHPGVHPDLARPVRRMVLGRPAGDAAGADLPARLVPVQRLRLGVLGAADHRPADHRRGVPASHAASVWPQRTLAGGRPERRRRWGAGTGRRTLAGPPCSAAWTGRCTATSGARTPPRTLRRRRCGPRCAAPRSAGAPSGSSPGRRPTAAGAASSRRGCTR